LAKYESKSLISVPLKYKDQVYGVINLNNKVNGRAFTEDDLNMLVSLALPAAVALDRANLIAEKTRTISELRVMHNLAEKVSMLDDPSLIGQATFEGLEKLYNLKFIFWYDYIERGSILQLEYHFGGEGNDKIPQSVMSISIPQESITINNGADIISVEGLLTNAVSRIIQEPQGYQLVPISIFLKRSLAGIAILGLPAGYEIRSNDKELLTLALSQTAAIYQRQRAVLNATQLVTMGRLLADIGHDLRKPLTNLKGSVQIYKDKIEGKKAREFFGDAEKEVNRLSELVKEMVEFANPNKYQTRRIDIRDLLDKSLDLLNSDLTKKSIAVSRSYPQELPTVLVNEREMYQVFVNIVLNAVDSMEERGRLGLKCLIVNEHGGDWLRVQIQDSGCGIPEDHIHRVFERYFTTKQTGTGLGLAIVDRIVSVHNGKILVQSKVGEGTVFTIDLPI
jgi:signal transduction histidine kinase